MLLLVLLSDFFVFFDFDLRMFLIGEKVVLDLTALPRLLFDYPPTLMIDGRMWGTFWFEILELFLLFLLSFFTDDIGKNGWLYIIPL